MRGIEIVRVGNVGGKQPVALVKSVRSLEELNVFAQQRSGVWLLGGCRTGCIFGRGQESGKIGVKEKTAWTSPSLL